MKKKNTTTAVSFILDESGSMDSIKPSVIEGFNKYISELKKQKGNIVFTLTKFDTNGIRTPYENKDIKKVEKLTDKTYQPNAMTPLYDACVKTIERISETKSDKAFLVAIMTDGYENSSTEHNEECLTDLIKKLQAKGNWTFVFLGANQDSWATAQRLGISKGNVMDWQATSTGTNQAFAAMAMATRNFSASVNRGESLKSASFFANTEGGDK